MNQSYYKYLCFLMVLGDPVKGSFNPKGIKTNRLRITTESSTSYLTSLAYKQTISKGKDRILKDKLNGVFLLCHFSSSPFSQWIVQGVL